MRIDLRVRLKTMDLVRETAWPTLRNALGWGEVVAGLERSTLWRCDGDAADDAAFRAALAAELEKSSAFYNPNKERAELLPAGALPEGEPLELAAALPAPSSPPGAGEPAFDALLWVTDEGGLREDQRRRSAARLAADGVRLTALRVGTLWSLRLVAPDAGIALGRLAGLALTRGRHEGLLLNPHYQEGRLLGLAPAEPAGAAEGGDAA